MALPKFSGFLVAALLLSAAPVVSAQSFFLKKGDIVVVMGDSITEQQLYSNYLEIWSQTRFPSYNLVFRNVGIGGDTSGGGNGRFKRDVLLHKPTALTVDFGMNDAGYQAFNEKRFDPYIKGLQGIADQAKAANIRVAWITPQPVEHNPGAPAESYNKTLERFSEGVGEIAKKNDGLFVDQFHPYAVVIQKARESGEKGRITGGDAVHPGAPGQALMAAAILKGMGFPRQVSMMEVQLAGKEKKMFGFLSRGCTGSDLAVKDGVVRFQRKDLALPFFPEQAKSILKWTPLLEEMNEYGLKVIGLKEGKYEVRLGGKKVSQYSEKELAAGVNLAAAALTTGPVADQVKDVVKAVDAKTSYYHGQIYAPLVLGRNLNFKDVAKEDIQKRRQELIAERMEKMPGLDAAIRKALEPRPHLVEIVPAQ